MKKVLTITGICIATLLVVMLILPFALKGKVADIVKSEGNKMLNAEFDFVELNISLFRHFPSATVALEDFYLKGVGEFQNDTLAQAKEVSATVNLFSLFGKGGYKISEILLDQVRLHAIVSEKGVANWDIVKPSEDEEDELDEVQEESSPFRIQLKELKVSDLCVIYDDRQAKMFAELKELDASCSGDFGSEHTLVKVTASTPSVTLKQHAMTILNAVNVATDMDIDADFVEKVYQLKQNKWMLNAIEANLDGWLKQIDDGYDMDLKLYSNEIGFKEILSLVPGMYTENFKQLKTDGKVTLTAFAKGMCKGDSVVPTFEVKLDVTEGSFKYPTLPEGVDHINIAMAVQNPGGNPDATTVRVDPFNFTLAGQPFGLTAQLKTPVSDLDFKLAAKGKLDLGKIKAVYPVKDMQLNGRVDADMRLSGKLSAIEKERYEEILAEGKLSLNDMNLELTDVPKMTIEQSVFSFSPKVLKLSETTVKMGDNDLTFDSQFENYLAYAFQGKTLKGTLNVKSNHLNLNDFMTDEVENEEVIEAKKVNGVNPSNATSSKNAGLIVPAAIDFRMQTNFKKVMLDKMVFEDINGLLIVKDQQVDMSNLSMNTMGGKVVANGAYATPSGQQASLKGSFALKELNFARTYSELDMVQQLAPIFAGLKGTYSGNISIDSRLDEQLKMDLHSVQGKGSLSTNDLSLSGVKFIDQVANIVKKPELKNIKVQNLNLDFSIDQGRVTTQPFDLKLGDYTMNLSGSTGLDQTIDYRGKITLPTSLGGKKRFGTVDMLIKGTFDKPEVSIDMASLAKNLAGQVFDSLTGKDDTTDDGEQKPKQQNVLDKALNLFNKKK